MARDELAMESDGKVVASYDSEQVIPMGAGSLYTTTPVGSMSLLLGPRAESIDSDGLLTTNTINVTWLNADAVYKPEFITEEFDAEVHIAYEKMEEFGTGSMGIIALLVEGPEVVGYDILGDPSWDPSGEDPTPPFRNFTAFQNFDQSTPDFSRVPTDVHYNDPSGFLYSQEEIQGLSDRFGGLPTGVSAEDEFNSKLRLMAQQVLSTFPSKELHFTKVKAPSLKPINMAAIIGTEISQGVNLMAQGIILEEEEY